MSPIYVILIINIIVWTGIFFYLLRTDNEIKKLRKRIERLSSKNIKTGNNQ